MPAIAVQHCVADHFPDAASQVCQLAIIRDAPLGEHVQPVAVRAQAARNHSESILIQATATNDRDHLPGLKECPAA